MIAVIKRIRWYLWILIVLVLAYVGVSIYFMEHFFPGTTFNGANADLYTVKQVNELYRTATAALKEGNNDDALKALEEMKAIQAEMPKKVNRINDKIKSLERKIK